MKKFNINEYVYVKLNDKGKRIISEDHIHSKYTKADSKGFYKFQMWDFIKTFGKHVGMGYDAICENNLIYFKEHSFIQKD